MKSRLLKTILTLLVPVVIDYVVKKLSERKNAKPEPQTPSKSLPKSL